MIYIDNRVGSADLFPYFPKGLASLTTLDYADAAFMGNGPDSQTWFIGIERKRISDLINSMCSGRLSGHQLPGLHNSYNCIYLVVEGIWRPSPKDGTIEIPVHKRWVTLRLGSRVFMAREVYNYLNTLSLLGGVHVWAGSASPRETANYIQSIFSWWNSKPFEDHKSLDVAYSPTVHFLTKKAGLLQRVAGELPGIGQRKAKKIAGYFRDVRQMVNAEVKEFMEIEGVGKTLAEKIVRAVRGEAGRNNDNHK